MMPLITPAWPIRGIVHILFVNFDISINDTLCWLSTRYINAKTNINFSYFTFYNCYKT